MQGQQIKLSVKIDDGKQHPMMEEIKEGLSKVPPHFDLAADGPPMSQLLKADAYKLSLDEESAEKVDELGGDGKKRKNKEKEPPVQQKAFQFKRREEEALEAGEGIQMKKEGEVAPFQQSPVQLKREEEKEPFQLKSKGASSLDNPEPFQLKQENQTGMSDRLKSGVEKLSGVAMDDVRVNFNSEKPAQMKALAYAQGSEIHLGPGQEKHLPHEAWHVAQQKQGRVSANKQFKGGVLNDDPALEREADIMGAKAMQMGAGVDEVGQLRRARSGNSDAVQRVIAPGEANGEFFDDTTNEDYCLIHQYPNTGHAYYAKKSSLNVFRNRIITGDITYNLNLGQNGINSIINSWFNKLAKNKIDSSDPALQALEQVQFVEVGDDQQADAALPESLDNALKSTLIGKNWGRKAFRRKGFGDRAPKARGTLYINKASSMNAGSIYEFLELEQADFKINKRFEGVGQRNLEPREYQEQLDFFRNSEATLIDSRASDFFYVSGATRNDPVQQRGKTDQIYTIAGTRYNSLEEIENDKDRIGPLYRQLEANRSGRGWSEVNRRGNRNGTQAQAMGNWNALGAAAYAKQVLGMNLSINQEWEWLHIQGVQNGGNNVKENLGSGTWKANSAMIPYENKIRAWGNEREGKLYAAYKVTTQSGNSPILKTITILIAADENHSIGPINQNDPVGIVFDATQGVISDGFTNKIEMRDFTIQKDERQASEQFRQACEDPHNMNEQESTGYLRSILQSNPKQAARVFTHVSETARGIVMNNLHAGECWKLASLMAHNQRADLAYEFINFGGRGLIENAGNVELAMFLNNIDETHFIKYFDWVSLFVKNMIAKHLKQSHILAYKKSKAPQVQLPPQPINNNVQTNTLYNYFEVDNNNNNNSNSNDSHPEDIEMKNT